MARRLRVVLLKPSKYGLDGAVERFRWGFVPNSTLPYLRSLTPPEVRGAPVEVRTVDEYVHTDLDYLALLEPEPGIRTLLALVGVQSHQLHRALDLAARARGRGTLAVLGGPHPMTCDTVALEGRGVAFAQAEAERVWPSILEDALAGELRPVYGREGRWQETLDPPVVTPPERGDLRRHVVPMLGLHPARGCPFTCTFCSVIKIFGRRVRSQPVETTLASLRAARAAGVRMILFTSDNFNKYPDAPELLRAMIDERLGLKFFVQCDVQVAEQEGLVELMARAGCFQIFVGVESFDRRTLVAAHKAQNRPERYAEIVRLCRQHGVTCHFSNILGFPEDTERGIERHLESLRSLGPTSASFYILTPIPGTEQYDEFLASGWILERNLDRFDATCLTWRHPRFSARELQAILFRCYRRFYDGRHAARAARDLRWGAGWDIYAHAIYGNWLLSRACAWIGRHPMAGGIGRVRADAAEDYRALRRRTFGIDLAPLPPSLPLSPRDEALNRTVNPRLGAAV